MLADHGRAMQKTPSSPQEANVSGKYTRMTAVSFSGENLSQSNTLSVGSANTANQRRAPKDCVSGARTAQGEHWEKLTRLPADGLALGGSLPFIYLLSRVTACFS